MKTQLQHITGTIEAANDRGVKVNGTWYNFSRWAEDIQPHSPGQAVELAIDKSGFVRSLTVKANGKASVPDNTPSTPTGLNKPPSAEWIRVQSLDIALRLAQLSGETLDLGTLYEWAGEIEAAILHGFPKLS